MSDSGREWGQDTKEAIFRRNIIAKCDKFGEIGPMDDGYQAFWIKDRGALSSSVLRIIADELDRRNAEWDDQVKADVESIRQRFEDQLQADGVAEEFLLRQKSMLDHAFLRLNWTNLENDDGRVGVLWFHRNPIAVVTIIRDEMNWSVVVGVTYTE